ncbi:MAG TPA: ABC transporter substrate-binding protein [Stellaceae bacterium]|nr:ABC transporter substrate-binding protein [Stellaceae bacterium]
MAIVLQESLRGLFYAPYYAALALDAYEKEGLEVRFVSAPHPAAAPNGLFHGTVDVTWGGPMRVNQVYDQRAHCDLVCFGEAVGRDPFMLIGRTPRANFRLAVLVAMRLATVSEVPTPWLCLQEDLRRIGINADTISRVRDNTMEENMAALRFGDVDVVQLYQPLAEELIASGEGYLWYAAANRGPCCYTSFYARQATLVDKREECLKLVRGLYRTQKWMQRSPPEALADVIRPYFPTVPHSLLRASIARYRALGIWAPDPILPRDGYERLVAGLVSGGFAKGTPYETAVDNRLAAQVVDEDPPALSL